jgi:hypothetical protein
MFGGALYLPASGGGAQNATTRGQDTRDDDRRAPAQPTVPNAKPVIHSDALREIARHFGIEENENAADAPDDGDRDHVRWSRIVSQAPPFQLESIIATVPDPIDSNAQWMFDPMVDAIQTAAADSGYVLDRFYIPDWTPEKGDVEPLGKEHERWPAVVLFRRANDRNLLLVSLVAETATSGVHQGAMRRALSVQEMINPSNDPEIKILGPTFSGSIDSLVHSLKTFAGEHPHVSFRIVSGGATRSTNRKIVEDALKGRASYRATVLTDDQMFCALTDQLQKIDRSIKDGHGVALLYESNTSWGQGLLQGASGLCASRKVVDNALRLPFPMHISRLRAAAADRPKTAANQAVPPRFRALELGETVIATDQIPTFSPKLTSSGVELALANTLDTLKKENITTVGLLATDTRDKLFLAQQLSRVAPGLTLFTLESDLLFVHPDYNNYVRGMFIASTYPLFTLNQSWTQEDGAGVAARHQFSTTNAEGTYNAFLALEYYNVDGTALPLPAGETRPAPIDYRPPAPRDCPSAGCLPAVWISVVAKDALWPIGYGWPFSSTDPPKADETVQVLQQAPMAKNLTLHPSELMIGALLAFAIFSLLACYRYVEWRRKGPAWRALPTLKGLDRGAAAVRYQSVALTALAFMSVFTTLVSALAFGITAHAFPKTFDHAVYFVAIVAGLCVFGVTVRSWYELARWMTRKDGEDADQTLLYGDAKRVRRDILIVVGLVTLLTAYYLVKFVDVYWWNALQTPNRFVRFAERALHPEDGVSVLVPVFFLLTPIFCWALVQIWRVGGPRLAPVLTTTKNTVRWIGTLAKGVDDAWCERLVCLSDRPLGGLPVIWQQVLLVGLACTIILLKRVGIVTVEEYPFSSFIEMLWVLCQFFIALSFAQSLYLALLLNQLLRALASSKLVDAFGRLPREAFAAHYRFSPKSPGRGDLLRLSYHCAALSAALEHANPVNVAERVPSHHVHGLHNALGAGLPTDLSEIPNAPCTNTSTFATLLDHAETIASWLPNSWSFGPGDTFLSRERDTATTNTLRQWTLRAEEYLALLITLLLRELLARLMKGLLFVVTALVCVILALSLFPIHPWQPLMAFVWLWMLVAAGASIAISVAMERDAVLSRLSGTQPNRLTWNAAFVTKVIVYGVVPLLTIFASQYPGLGGTLLRWLAPIQPLP